MRTRQLHREKTNTLPWPLGILYLSWHSFSDKNWRVLKDGNEEVLLFDHYTQLAAKKWETEDYVTSANPGPRGKQACLQRAAKGGSRWEKHAPETKSLFLSFAHKHCREPSLLVVIETNLDARREVPNSRGDNPVSMELLMPAFCFVCIISFLFIHFLFYFIVYCRWSKEYEECEEVQIEEMERYAEWMQIVSFCSNGVGIAVRLTVSGVSAGVVEVMELLLSSLYPHRYPYH